MNHTDRDGAESPSSIVVVGAGLAGVSACARLRELGYDGRLTLVGAEDRLPYDRPPLSKEFLAGPATPAEPLLRPAEWYPANGVELRLGVPVDRLDAADGLVRLADGAPEPADAVLLATGGRPRPLPAPGADHRAVVSLRTLADAERLRDLLVPGARVGVVGAGLIGAEVAAAAVARGCAVTLLDPFAPPLERVVGRPIAEALHAQHRENGVRVVNGAVRAIEDRGGAARLRIADTDETVDCDVVVVGIGIERDDALAARAGLATAGGVLVDDGQRTSHPRVFAAGDVARPVGPAGPLPGTEHWDAALQEGQTAAAAMLGRPLPPPRAFWFWSHRYGTRLEVVGEFLGAGRTTVLRGALDAGSFIALAVRDGYCVGAVAVNRPTEVKAVRRLIERRLPVAADRLADESVELGALVRAGSVPARTGTAAIPSVRPTAR